MADKTILYRRDLPGGGYVYVEADPDLEPELHRAKLFVERRADPSRRRGHLPPVIAIAEGQTITDLLRELEEIAGDNVSIAQRLRRLRNPSER